MCSMGIFIVVLLTLCCWAEEPHQRGHYKKDNQLKTIGGTSPPLFKFDDDSEDFLLKSEKQWDVGEPLPTPQGKGGIRIRGGGRGGRRGWGGRGIGFGTIGLGDKDFDWDGGCGWFCIGCLVVLFCFVMLFFAKLVECAVGWSHEMFN